MKEKILNKNVLYWIVIVLLSLMAALSLYQGIQNALIYSQDFQYDAAKALALGYNPYDESLNPCKAWLALGYEEYYLQMEANQFPSLLFLLYPYTLLAPLTARYAWIVSNLVFLALFIVLLRKTFFKDMDGRLFTVFTLLMIAGTPFRNHLGVGQHTLFSAVFFMIAVYLSEYREHNSTFFAAMALCVSYFKYTLTVPLALYFVYKKRWKLLAVSVLPHILMTALAAMWLNAPFEDMIIKPLKVASALMSEGSLDIGSLIGGGPLTVIITVIIMLGLVALMFFIPPGQDLYVVSILLIFSLIMTYHRSYDYFMLILPAAYIFGNINGKAMCQSWIKAFYLILLGAVFFALRIFNEAPFALWICAIMYYCFILSFVVSEKAA